MKFSQVAAFFLPKAVETAILCHHYNIDPRLARVPKPLGATQTIKEAAETLGCSEDNVLRICLESNYINAYVRTAKYDLYSLGKHNELSPNIMDPKNWTGD